MKIITLILIGGLPLWMVPAVGQNRPGSLVSASSGMQKVNTLAFFESPEKEPVDSKKEKENENKIPAVQPPIAEIGKPAPKNKPEPRSEPSDPDGIRTVYFDKRENPTTKEGNAYFIRQAKFDRATNQPKGVVKDFYKLSGKPKFEGQYRHYESKYEERNRDYDGLCKFFEEDGSYALRQYEKKRVVRETKYTPDNQMITQTEFDLTGNRRKFRDYVFDKNGNQIGSVEGGFNSKTNREEAVKRINYQNGKPKSIVYMVNNCPQSKAEHFTENGLRHDVYFLDFDCEPSGQWRFVNKSNFQTTHKTDPNGFKVMAVNAREEGMLQMPVSYDFYNSPYEIVASFDLHEQRPMTEFGIVWEYKDNVNFSYLKINVQKKTFEVNAVKAGNVERYMAGVRQPALEIGSGQVTVSFRNGGGERVFKLNGEPLKYLKGDVPVNFDKLPRVDFEKELKSWGIGFYFRSGMINDGITLRSIEIRLL